MPKSGQNNNSGKNSEEVKRLLEEAEVHLNRSISERGTTKKYLDRALRKTSSKSKS